MEECPVCYEKKEMETLRCGHKLCDSCRDKWFQTSPTCPTCRTPVIHPDFLWNDCCPPPVSLTREQELEVRFVTLVADIFELMRNRESVSASPSTSGA